MADRTYDINSFYPYPESNGYGKEFAYHRFQILKKYKFESLLDVGSGPCFLHEWLRENNINCVYEAVDIRKDSLSNCDCTKYYTIPNKIYDMVCMFGTVTYNIDNDINKNKEVFLTLLNNCFSVSNKYVLFTLMKENQKQKIFVEYTRKEIEEILQGRKFQIEEYLDYSEYMVVCE